MQIACKKFGCQKAVEVCYWSCKHRRNCKDWRGAVDSQPGEAAIRERLEGAAKKSGRLFDAATLVSPGRAKRVVTAPSVSLLTAPEPVSPAVKAKPRPAALPLTVKPTTPKAQPPRPATNPKPQFRKVKEKMAKPQTEENVTTPAEPFENPAENKEAAPKPKKKAAAKPRQATTGTVYLLLSGNGKYRELRESELMAEAAAILRDPSLRLVKGQFLVPQITFKAADE
jgi:outer membrane biosynthesis protein TonB